MHSRLLTARCLLTSAPSFAAAQRPTDFGFAFNLLYALAVPFYICCAVFGFYAFGNMASANQVENLRDGLEVRIALYASLVTTFPVIVLGQVVLLLSVEIPLGILPTDWLVNNSAAHLESPTAARLRKFPPVLLRLPSRPPACPASPASPSPSRPQWPLPRAPRLAALISSNASRPSVS